MLSEQALGDWDFAPVHDFLRSTSLAERPPTQVSFGHHFSTDQYNSSSHLGDFGKIWQYLGQPLSVPSPTVHHPPGDESKAPVGEDFYIKALSDGLSKNKGVRWRDELEREGLANHSGAADFESLPSLADSQRNRARLRAELAQKELAKHQGPVDSTSARALTDSRTNRAIRRNKLRDQEQAKTKAWLSGSENESEKEVWTPERSQARKAVINGIVHGHPDKIESVVSNPPRQSGKSQLRGDAQPWPFLSLRILAPPTKPSVSEEETGYAAAAAEKKARLIAKLRESFIEERQYLNNIRLITNIADGDNSTDVGVHVFVDASNVRVFISNSTGWCLD